MTEELKETDCETCTWSVKYPIAELKLACGNKNSSHYLETVKSNRENVIYCADWVKK